MHQRRMDAEGVRVVHREWRARKLAVVVAVQNLVVAACLFVTLYFYWAVRHPEDNVHILFEVTKGPPENGTLQFNQIYSMHKMSLIDKSQIRVSCNGPYVLYIYMCYESRSKEKTNGTLQLQVVGKEIPASSFTLQATHEDCRGLHSIAYLKAKDKASLHLSADHLFKITKVTVGLNSLLGNRCDY